MAYLCIAIAAALAFTTGGVFMKHAAGLTRVVPTLAVFALFIVGATLNIVLVQRNGDLGPAYVIVVGLEAVLACAFGAAFFGEALSGGRIAAMTLIVAGITLLQVASD